MGNFGRKRGNKGDFCKDGRQLVDRRDGDLGREVGLMVRKGWQWWWRVIMREE